MENNFNKIIKIVAYNISSFRKKRNLSQEKLAELCGLHRTYIGAIERAEKNLTIKTLLKISTALNVPLETLISKKDK